jgi:hypothetical protein
LTYGLQQKLICQNLVQAILTNNADAMATFTDFYTMSDPSKLNLADFFFNVRYDIQTRFFGSAYTIQDANEYIFGFTNSAADMINGGDFYNGDDFSLSNTTSPIFHDKIGNQAATEYGMYTGSNKLSNIGNLRNTCNDIPCAGNVAQGVCRGTRFSRLSKGKVERVWKALAGPSGILHAPSEVLIACRSFAHDTKFWRLL